jgi:hypothetical protein
MRSLSRYLLRGLVAIALLAPAAIVGASPVSAAALNASGACASGIGNGGGQGIICEVTIVNTITATGGSARVTVHQCLGSAGAPLDGSCSTTTTHPGAPVTSVAQCNDSLVGTGGGSTLRCSVNVTNNFYNLSTGSSAVTVNQCVGSGSSITTGCDPFPATTTGAAITQCNGSGNGGTLVQFTCTATGTMSSRLPVTINQCNGSANGGGELVICTTSMVNRLIPLPAPTSTADAGSSSDSATVTTLMLVLALGGFVLAAAITTKRRGVQV